MPNYHTSKAHRTPLYSLNLRTEEFKFFQDILLHGEGVVNSPGRCELSPADLSFAVEADLIGLKITTC